ncbi:MAG: alkaline phosphatase family protein [Acidobacteriota bacterium]|jgi:hypothetical protein
MKLLKLLVQSAPAALLFALSLGLLVFYVNPSQALGLRGLWWTTGACFLVPGLVAWIAWPLALMALRFFAEHPAEPGWFRFERFHRFYLLDTTVAAAIWWGNYLATPALLPLPAHRLLLAGCGMITLLGCLSALASLPRSLVRGLRPRWVQGTLLVVLFGGLFGLRVGGGGEVPGAGGPLRVGPVPPRGRLVLVGIEGLSPEFVLPLAAEGRLPSLAAMLREGGRARVQARGPQVPPAAWTTVISGVLPRRHGIVDRSRWRLLADGSELTLAPRFVGFRLLVAAGLVDPVALSSGDRREPAIWQLLEGARLRSVVVGWPAAEPPDAGRTRFLPVRGPGPDPPGIDAAVDRLAEWGNDAEGRRLQAVAREAIGQDARALARAGEAIEAGEAELILVHLPGLGSVQREFLGKAVPPALRWSPGEPDPAYGEVIARYHRFLDEGLAALRARVRAGPPLWIVMSTSGVRRPAPWALFLGRFSGWRWLGPHGRPPAGMLLAAGPGIVAGIDAGDLEPQDLLPTAAYYLGLPVARDLDGRPRTSLFDEEFITQHPAAYIPSYRRRAER